MGGAEAGLWPMLSCVQMADQNLGSTHALGKATSCILIWTQGKCFKKKCSRTHCAIQTV